MIRERERERERDVVLSHIFITHDLKTTPKKELRFFKKKKKRKVDKKTDHCVLSSLRNTTRIISSLSNNNNGCNKSPPLVKARSCSSTPPRRTLKSWVSRCKTASRMPRRKSLSNRSFVGRPVVKAKCRGDITTKEGRIAPNVARSNVGCKTITGQPCVDFVSGK